jgi:hypothetical protein
MGCLGDAPVRQHPETLFLKPLETAMEQPQRPLAGKAGYLLSNRLKQDSHFLSDSIHHALTWKQYNMLVQNRRFSSDQKISTLFAWQEKYPL